MFRKNSQILKSSILFIFLIYGSTSQVSLAQTPSPSPSPTSTISISQDTTEFIQSRLAKFLPQNAFARMSTQRHIVRFNSSALTALAIRAQVAQYPNHVVEDALLKMYGQVKVKFRRELSGVYAVQLSSGASPDAIATVANISPDRRLTPRGYTDDPLFDQQWGLHNSGSSALSNSLNMPLVAGIDINAAAAWNSMGEQQVPLVVAVFDTGMRASHEDLFDSRWVNESEERGIPGVDDDNNGYVDDVSGIDLVHGAGLQMASDEGGHGTLVSGIIAAKNGNGVGISGVCPHCEILTIKSDFNGVYYLSDLILSLRYSTYLREQFIAGNGGANVRVFNMSNGAAAPCRRDVDDGIDLFLDALEEAGEAGILVVGATANSPINFDLPEFEDIPTTCEASNVVSVGNLQGNGTLAPSSGFGKNSVKLAAPGTRILSTGKDNDQHYTGEYSGTSFAAPHVSGAASLVMQTNPGLLPEEVIDILVSTSEHSNELNKFISAGGVVNAWRAVLKARADFNLDGVVNAIDINLLRQEINRLSSSDRFDINSDGWINNEDMHALIHEAIGTFPGDANLDCKVDSIDFNIVRNNSWSQNAGWEEGNFNFDSVVDGSDINIWNSNKFLTGRCAYQTSTSTRPPRPAG